MIKYLQALVDSFLQLNPIVTAATGMVTLIIALFTFTNEMWGVLVAKLATLVLPTAVAAAAVDGYAFIDYFFPAHETFAFLTAYLGVVGLCALIRIVKSFIPTIN